VEISLADPALLPTVAAVNTAPSAPREFPVTAEGPTTFAARVGQLDASAVSRIRLLGIADETLLEAAAARPDIALFREGVVASGRVELLTFLHEQAISATDHRYGNPLPEPLDLTGGRGYVRGR
jgi:RHH-type proline utilization regulon transcriptional repressor/proline dehydrogenase/delta 1-pyrroline-5-carboxylate dehydrogenase